MGEVPLYMCLKFLSGQDKIVIAGNHELTFDTESYPRYSTPL